MSRARLVTAALVGSIILLGAGGFAGGCAVTHAVRDGRGPEHSAAPLPGAYRAAAKPPARSPSATSAPLPSSAAVGATLASLVHARGLGPRLRAYVLDVASGAVLYDRDGSTPTAPASTAKLLVAAAVLSVHRATDRITTRVVAGGGGAVVLVGAGDPTLSGAAKGRPTAYTDAARISDLAAQLRAAGVRPTSIVVDGSLFSGPTVSPYWARDDVPSEYAAPITAVLVDGGRAAPDDEERSTVPDLAAGRALAAALGRPGLPVTRGTAPDGARVLARVTSAPIGTLVEQMLLLSDNVIAECLARQVAIAENLPASFTGSVQAIRAVLRGLGLDPGDGMLDASGLAERDRLDAATLARAVRLVAGPDHPQLHAVISAMPVAAWSGTLANRYVKGASRGGAGVVRAKTGTLTRVSTLAGVVHDRSGRVLAFAFLADGANDTLAAEAALDALAARLAACGCG